MEDFEKYAQQQLQKYESPVDAEKLWRKMEPVLHPDKKKRRFFLPIGDVEGELMEKLEANADFVTSGEGTGPTGEEIQLKLQKALLKLPTKQRLVFNMKYFDEMKYEDMSEITGTSVGALKASYHIAVKKIEEYLTKTDIDD